MIPTIEDILRMLSSGDCTLEQALAWFRQHESIRQKKESEALASQRRYFSTENDGERVTLLRMQGVLTELFRQAELLVDAKPEDVNDSRVFMLREAVKEVRSMDALKRADKDIRLAKAAPVMLEALQDIAREYGARERRILRDEAGKFDDYDTGRASAISEIFEIAYPAIIAGGGEEAVPQPEVK